MFFRLHNFIFAVAALFAGDFSWAVESLRTELPAIRVRPTERERTIRPVPRENSEFNGEIIAVPKEGDTSVARLLGRSAAVTSLNTGSDQATALIMIRGQDPGQARYFIDEVPLSDAEFNSANLNLVPVETLERVEIFPEGVPATLGADGLGGAIDLRLRPVRLREKSGTRAGLSGGSYGALRAALGGHADTPVAIDLHVDYSQSEENFSYFDDNGTPFNAMDDRLQTRLHNRFRHFTFFPHVLLLDSRFHRLRAFSLTSFRDTQVPGSTAQLTSGTLNQKFNLTAMIYEGELGNDWSWRSQIYAKIFRDELSQVAPLPSLLGGNLGGLSGGIKNRFAWSRDGWSAEMMAAAENENFRAHPQGNREYFTRRFVAPLGISSTIALTRALSLRPALAAEYFSYRGGVGERDLFLLSPRIGATFGILANVQLRAGAGSFFRAPTMYELYGTPAGISPSRDLRHETAKKFEVGADARFDTGLVGVESVRAAYTFSVSHARDLISYLQNSPTTRIAVNVGSSQIYSHEFSAELTGVRSTSLKNSLALMNAENLSSLPSQNGKILPLRAGYRWSAELGWHPARFSVTYRYSLSGPTYWDLENLKRLSAVSDHGVSFGWTSRAFGSVQLEVRNLADTITANSQFGSFQTTDNTTGLLGYPAPGRRVYLSWKYEI